MKNSLDTIDPNTLDNTTGGGLADTWKKASEKISGALRDPAGTLRDLVNPRPTGPRPCYVCGLG